MNVPSYADIEEALYPVRESRRPVMEALLKPLITGKVCAEPFLALSRFFCRLKSADSIVEKLKRKRIEVSDASEIPGCMPDILGFRLIVANDSELWSVDELIRNHFEILSRHDHITAPGEFGDRGMEYSARYHSRGVAYPFELQLRTFLQHYWASQSFRLFHKKPREVALEHRDLLLRFAEVLALAEDCSSRLAAPKDPRCGVVNVETVLSVLNGRVYLVVVEPDEQFASQIVQPLSGDDRKDHDAIASRKIDLYSAHPGAALVECSCLSFLTFHLNESQVQVPLERLQNVNL